MGWIKDMLSNQIEDLMKSDGDLLPEMPEDMSVSDQVGRKAIIEDPFYQQAGQQVIYKHKASKLSNKTLKDVSLRDWLVSAIIQNRCDTTARFSRPQKNRFDTAFHICKKDCKSDVSAEELKEMKIIEDFIYNCGRTENTPLDDRMLFGEFLKLATRDVLTFGHMSIEKVMTRGKALHRFRPLPAEQVYLVDKKASKDLVSKEIIAASKAMKPGPNDPRKKQTITNMPLEYYKYIQMSYDNRTLAVFGDEDMVFKLFNPQNFSDSMGYCYSPLELAIINITTHLNVENYNSNFFTHGYAARGILHLKGTVTQSQLTAFRRQFYSTINGTQNAWRTPIISGLEGVDWVSMSGSAKEMEYINYNSHVMRSICSQFQIDPMELGLDYLVGGTGKAPAGANGNESQIELSRERGLLPILMYFEDFINCDILPAIDKALSDKYEFKFTGYTNETPQTAVALQQAEMTVHSSMNDLLREAKKEKIDAIGADLPLNQSFWAIIEKNYTKGEIREIFFGDKGASKKRELQYIPGDPAYMGWQQLLLTMDRQKIQDQQMKAQMAAQQEAEQQEAARSEQESLRDQEAHEREGEQHDHAMADAKAQAAKGVANASLQDIAKEAGATGANFVGGKPQKNPLNQE